jgi:hypothetical protein
VLTVNVSVLVLSSPEIDVRFKMSWQELKTEQPDAVPISYASGIKTGPRLFVAIVVPKPSSLLIELTIYFAIEIFSIHCYSPSSQVHRHSAPIDNFIEDVYSSCYRTIQGQALLVCTPNRTSTMLIKSSGLNNPALSVSYGSWRN